jgi:hypothetical protein
MSRLSPLHVSFICDHSILIRYCNVLKKTVFTYTPVFLQLTVYELYVILTSENQSFVRLPHLARPVLTRPDLTATRNFTLTSLLY